MRRSATAMATNPLILRGGRVLRAGATRPERLDMVISAEGRIAALTPVASPLPGVQEIDLAGRLVTPGLIDAHQHLDKSRTRREVSNPAGTLSGAITAFRNYAAHSMTREEIMARAERTMAACLTRGTVVIRSHANVDAELQTRGVEALLDVRQRWQDRLQLQVVAFLSGAASRNLAAARAWMHAALDAGADVVGGTPAHADDPQAFLDLLFGVAERYNRRLDLHLDEHLDAGRHHFEHVIARTRALGLRGRVVASHSSVLSALPPDEAQRLIASLADAGIGVITLPAANLFLQGRDASRLPPRGLTRVAELLAAGVPVACASDNIQDPFVPTGSGDMLEIARWTFLAGHLGCDELAQAYAMATSIPAQLLGLSDAYGIYEGARADLLITDAEDAEDMVASGPLERTVFFGGKLVAGRV
jgi:cytosine/creatinine deaminase